MLLSTLATVAGAVGSLIAGINSAKANDNAQEIQNRQHQDNVNVLNSRLNADYTGRADVQNILTKTRELLDRQYNRAQGESIVAGATDSAVAAQKKANNEALGNTMANIAAQSSAYKEGLANALMSENSNYANQSAQIQRNKANTIAQAGSQVSQAMTGLAGADNYTYADDLAMFGLTDGLKFNEQTGHWYRSPKQD